MPVALSLTLNEASYVVGQSSTAINRAVDRGLIKAKVRQHGKIRLRRVGSAELRFLAIAGEVERDLTPAARRKVYEAIRRLPADAHRLELGVMELRLAEVDRRIEERLRRLQEIRDAVDAAGGADPVLRGTALPVHAVAALARGQSAAEIIEDLPGLTEAQIEAAVDYARIYPRTGRPLPARSFKRTLVRLAQTGVWDVEDDEAVPAPRPMP